MRMVGAANLHSGFSTFSESSALESCVHPIADSTSAAVTTSQWGLVPGGTTNKTNFTLRTNSATPSGAAACMSLSIDNEGSIQSGSCGAPGGHHVKFGCMHRRAQTMGSMFQDRDERMHVHQFARLHASQPLANGEGELFTRSV